MSTPMVALKDCCRVVGGATPKRNVPEYWGEDVPWVTPKDISDLDVTTLHDAPEYISEAGYKSCATYLLPKGSILLTSRAPIGNVAIVGQEMCTNQGFKSLVPGDDVDSLYLYYCIKYLSPKLQAMGNGATFKEVSKKIVEQFQIPLPPLEEQKRIAAILDKADAIRRKRRQAIDLTDQLLRSVFLEMFGDPVTNPKGWELATLGELLDFLTSGSRGWAKYYSDTGVPFLRIQNIGKNQLLTADMAHVQPPESAEAKRTRVEVDDVIFSITADLGRTAVIPKGFEGHINQHLAILRTKKIDSVFLSQFLASDGGQLQVKKLDREGVKSGLNFDDIRSLVIPTPPDELQASFRAFYSRRLDVLGAELDKLQVADTLFSSLAQQAFSRSAVKGIEAA